MTSTTMMVGEHVFHLIFQTEDAHCLYNEVFQEVKLVNGTPDVTLEVDSGYGKPFADYQVTREDSRPGWITYLRTDYRLAIREDYASVEIEVFDSLALKHALMHAASSYLLHIGWGLLVHSSCIHENGQAYLFTGHSGAGKSTVTAMSLPRGVYSDEASLIKIGDGSVTVFHSPFRSDFYTPLAEQLEPGKLAGVHLLIQSLENARIPKRKVDGMLAMMDKVFFWAPSPKETSSIMKQLRALAEQVPIYELYFRKEPAFWELIT